MKNASKSILDEDFVPVLTEKQKKTKKINRFITDSHDRISKRKTA